MGYVPCTWPVHQKTRWRPFQISAKQIPKLWCLSQIAKQFEVFAQVWSICLVFKWLGLFDIQMAFENQTIWHPTAFRPFEYQTSSQFRFPLYMLDKIASTVAAQNLNTFRVRMKDLSFEWFGLRATIPKWNKNARIWNGRKICGSHFWFMLECRNLLSILLDHFNVVESAPT